MSKSLKAKKADSALAEYRQTHIGRLFQQLARDFSQQALEKLNQAGHPAIKPFQAELISHLDLEGTRLTQLAQRMGTTKQTMGEAISSLEKQGYLRRRADPSDARANLVVFTEQGRQFLEDAYALKLELEAEYTAILGSERFALLKSLMQEILDKRKTGLPSTATPKEAKNE